MMISFDKWLPDLEPELVTCPIPIIERRLREAIIESCEQANVWAVALPPIDLVKGQREYALEPERWTQIHSILSASVGDRRLLIDRGEIHVDERGLVSLATVPTQDTPPLDPARPTLKRRTLNLSVTLKPTRDALVCGEILYTDYHKMIISGALYKAFAMVNRLWSDPNQAARYRNIFEIDIADARRAIDRGFITGSQRMNYQHFATPSYGRITPNHFGVTR